MSAPGHNDIDAVFNEGLQQRRFLLQVDDATRKAQFFPRPLSLHGENRAHWVEASGQGEIVALTLNRTAHANAPFVLAWIRLEEGVRILARVDGVLEGLAPGQPVALSWRCVGGTYMPIFRTIPAKGDSR